MGRIRSLGMLFRRIAMESATRTLSVNEISDAVVARLLLSGELANLSQASFDSIEQESISLVDQVTRETISKLLGIQSEQTQSTEICPKCGGPVHQKATQGRSMHSRRGKVQFKTNVFRCEACRLDFFPSVQSTGM